MSVSDLTDEEKQVKIATACGVQIEILERAYRYPDYMGQPREERKLPDYLNDLNAMHRAWWTLDRKQRVQFSRVLREKIVLDGGHGSSFEEDIRACVENATARQRAEAFLKIL